MRKLSLVIAGILGAGSPLISQAATLGQAQVQSYLSERLEVRVPLMRSSDEPLDEITVQLAPPSFYREAGVPLANLTGNLTFAIESERGQDYVLIGSKRPIRDPIMSILLQVQSPQGRMIREYNLLLDPPSVASSATEETQSGSSQPATRRETSRPARAPAVSTGWQRVEPAENVELDATHKVEHGDTLSEIARDFVGEGEDIRPMMQAIIDANPQAFANGNGNALLAGAELKVPSSTETSDGTAGEASVAADEQRPALELLSPQDQGQGTATTLGGFGNLSRDNPLSAVSVVDSQPETTAATDAEAALDEEELESVKAENEALTEQLQALKEEIDSVKVEIDERDARIADLKDVVNDARQQAEQAEATQNNFWVQWGMYLTGAMGLLILALLIALGLRRARQDEEPAVSMPTTADVNNEPVADKAVAEHDTARVGTASAVAGGAAAGAFAAGGYDETETSESAGVESDANDPMNPEMALEEARVLESFNLTHQALELLQESLAEHPGHAGLQAAIARLNGIEQDEAGSGDVDGDAGTPDEETVSEGTETVAWDSEPENDEPGASWQADAEERTETATEPAGEISWDDDFDDMLATPETEAAPTTDENLMEFDDSFALETPAEPENAGGEEPSEESESTDETLLDLPESETSSDDQEEGARATSDDEPEALDLDLSGYEPEAASNSEATVDTTEDTGLELDMTPEPEEDAETEPSASASDSAAESEADIDTRVSLAEAFLDVGDRESFEMIEAELREEGAQSALERLDELKQRYET
ncbi:hypothetical protein LV476_02905 [Guyparkeria hydrothermalis]|uniref:type IV pilus assembly protein FimV n=1 Tax=Guyparkeria hydrothermalis TaxID=923 RepID=UPI00202162E2|nr:hypothetical protein [Guyparkeria hydrothermalis]MCL7743901.1 hypothetical protein [Guyparkeria hydrothermalis]